MSAVWDVLRENRYPVQLRDSSLSTVNFKINYKPLDFPKKRTDESIHRDNRYTVHPPEAHVLYKYFQDHLVQMQKILTHERNGTRTFPCGAWVRKE
jgi:hypothetical protein